MKEGREKSLVKGLKEGKQQGLQQGLQQGIQKGIEQGREKGAKDKSLEIAKKMIAKQRPIEEILEFTELSTDEINQLN